MPQMILGADMLSNRIQHGDLVVQINNGMKVMGVVHGGMTKGGQIRYISKFGKKNSSHDYNLIKVSEEQIQNHIEADKHWIENQIRYHNQQGNEVDAGYYQEQLNRYEESIESLLQIHRDAQQ